MSELRNTLHGLAMELGVESPLARKAETPDVGAGGEAAARAAAPVTAVPGMVEQETAEQKAAEQKAAGQEFGISVCAGRIHVQNATGKVIGIGDLREASHVYGYALDDGTANGQGFPDLGTALRDLAGRLTFSHLDALFRTQPDVADEAGLHSVSAPALRVRLLPPAGEPRAPGAGTPGR